jgi:hypothetical protein
MTGPVAGGLRIRHRHFQPALPQPSGAIGGACIVQTARCMRLLRLVVFTLLGTAIAYIFAANAILALGGVQKAFESTEDVKVAFRRAWSFWPGRVRVDGLRITMQDRNVQFVLDIPVAEVDIRLRDLARRTFHATRVRANGVAFRFRHRIQPESAGIPYVAAYPPMRWNGSAGGRTSRSKAPRADL